MSVELNHTIIWCSDKARSAAFLTGILGLPPARPFLHFLVVDLANRVSVDYYQIRITGAITAPTPDDAITACFGAPDGQGNYAPAAGAAASAACLAIRRNPLNGSLSGVSRH